MLRNQPLRWLAVALVLGTGAWACSRPPVRRTSSGIPLMGPLIPTRATMVTAWEYPDNPLVDRALDESPLSRQIRWGFQIFTNTPREAAEITPSRVACNNCHLNGGQRERSLPLVGVAGMFPEYNRRAGRLISLNDRIVDCFLRSENATGFRANEDLPSTASKEVLALAAYIAWLSRGQPVGASPAWRGQNTIPAAKLIPVNRLNPAAGKAIFAERCTSCHGVDGQGVTVGDKTPGPLWGRASWNDGAGAARVYTLAGIIRYSMPYLDPGSLSDEEAQHVAAYINSQPRPSYPFKDQDYLTEKLPADAVYYAKR